MNEIYPQEFEQLKEDLLEQQQKIKYLENKMAEVITELEMQLEKMSASHAVMRPKFLARCYYRIRQSAYVSRMYRYLKTLPGVNLILKWCLDHIKQKM